MSEFAASPPQEPPTSTPSTQLPAFCKRRQKTSGRTTPSSLRHHESITLSRFTTLPLLLVLPFAHAKTNMLKLLQQCTEKPSTLRSAQVGTGTSVT